jgi:hypothetical protein
MAAGLVMIERCDGLGSLEYNLTGSRPVTPSRSKFQSLLSDCGETLSDRVWIVKVHMLAERLEYRHLSEAEHKITHAQVVN